MSSFVRQFFSWVFHPIFMPMVGCLVIWYAYPSLVFLMQKPQVIMLGSVVLLNTILIPGIATFYLARKKIISSLHLHEKNERRIPFLVTAVSHVIACYMIRELFLPKQFYLVILGAAAASFIALIVNYKSKISIHMVGMGGITGIIASVLNVASNDMSYLLIFQIILSGIVGSVRIAGHEHSSEQIYTGFIVGFFCEYLILVLSR
jgi:hypothetical protein